MHELSIASAIVDRVLEIAAERRVDRVLAVHLAVGTLTLVEPAQLRFCYNQITRDTALADSILEIEAQEAQVTCSHCTYSGPPTYWEDALAPPPLPTLQCPVCGQLADPTQGHECTITNIRATCGGEA